MKKTILAVLVALVFVFVASTVQASVSEDLGAFTNLYAGTSGPAQSSVQLSLQKAQQNQSGLFYTDQGHQVMAVGNVVSGNYGDAMVGIQTGTVLSNRICDFGNAIQGATSNTSVVTDAYKNGTASASVGSSTYQNAMTPKAMSTNMDIVMVFSASSVLGNPCGNLGSASNCIDISTLENSWASGCPQTLCPPVVTPTPVNPCNPCQ
jgi:hypothetical protein